MTITERSPGARGPGPRRHRIGFGLPSSGSAWVLCAGIASSVTALCLTVGASVAQDASGAWFTQDQVNRGTRVFTVECGGCHGPTLTEVLAESDSAYAFYAMISGSMPWENPGALSRQQYADIIAYLMSELGYPAGEAELPPDRDLLASILPAEGPMPAAATTQEDTEATQAAASSAAPVETPADQTEVAEEDAAEPPAATDAGGFFTVAQADQGIRDFAIACGNCHGPDMVEIFQTYPTVADYFQFITGAMPNDDPGNLAPRQYLSVVAYLLRESGFPAGNAELARDLELMRTMIPASPPE
jgi:mono/diheme cytochrome c family protein